ncbi:MAG: hypothetical protein ACRD3D_11105 [Terriglobia bacterium]
MNKSKLIPVLVLCLGVAGLNVRCGGGNAGAPATGGGSGGGGGALSLTSLSPIVASQNGSAFTLTVNGAGFAAGGEVTFNGTPEPTTATSSTQLTAQIPASALIAPSTGSGFPVGVRGGSNSPSPLNFYVVPAITPSTVSVTAHAVTSGIDIQPAALTPTLELQSIGGCVCSTETTAGSAEVTVGPGQTVNLFVVGNGMVAGTYYIVTGSGVTVTEPVASDFTQTTSPVTPAVNFNIVVSASAPAGPRNLVVTNPAGEISIYPGAIVVGSGS